MLFILFCQIGETTSGKYKLTARGLSGIDFHKSTDIEYVHKSYSVFIQTDRAIYKPGHKVMFRCIILDSRLRPSIVGPTDVYIVVSNLVLSYHNHKNNHKNHMCPYLNVAIFVRHSKMRIYTTNF